MYLRVIFLAYIFLIKGRLTVKTKEFLVQFAWSNEKHHTTPDKLSLIMFHVKPSSSMKSIMRLMTTHARTVSSISSQPLLFATHARNAPLSRNFSSSSHDDFSPKQKTTVPESTEEVHALIRDHVTKNPVMLYMKGNPSQPMCGFSATVVKILREYSIDFSSVNVLEYPSIRNGIRTFSSWPTVPQLYVNGEFIGGCDIVQTMHSNGELKQVLQSALPK
jgi:monothiol glutaredoxin